MGWGWRRLGAIGIMGLVCASASARTCQVKTAKEILAGIPVLEKEVHSLLATTAITGIGIAIAHKGRFVFAKNYGDGVVNPLFQAASIGKVVSAYGAMRLVEKGKMDLGEPLSKYVLKPYLPPGPYGDQVTLQTVLNHTSGMTNDPDGIDRSIGFAPGTDYSYSGAGFHYMQQAVEDISGQSFNSYMVKEMKRLGMKNSSFELEHEGTLWVGAAYSLVTTPKELLRFFHELSHPRAENAWVARRMTTPTWKFDPQDSVGLGARISYCGGETAIHHTGCNFDWHRATAMAFRQSEIEVVVMVRGKDSYGAPSKLAELAVGGF